MRSENTFSFSKTILRILGMCVIPLLCIAAMSVACFANGTSLFTGRSTVQLYFRGLAYVLLLAFGVSINMHTGRFDFSAGATMLFGGVTGALIANALSLPPAVMFLISIPAGAAIGLINGFLYINLNLPPMIIGLGMTLVVEGVIAIITGGLSPVGFGTDPSFYRFSVNIPAMLTIMAVALVFMVIAFHYTPFGYDYRALQSGQKIGVNSGIKEKKNALLCYIFAGMMFGGAGAISICATNGVTPTINFSTIGSMFSCFLPLFFSGFISKFCNKQIAVFLGCVSYEFIQIGFGQLSFAISSFTSDVYNVVEAIILVAFLIYLNNEEKIIGFFDLRRRIDKKSATGESL